MIKVYSVRPERRGEIPAVTHVDGTGRLQTVDAGANPLYWKLIQAFGNRTGVPVVLNTSFNENEPIVCRPEEAIDCFLRTRMDALAIGNFVIRKQSAAHGNRLNAFSGWEAPASGEHQAPELVHTASRVAAGALIAPIRAEDVPIVVELHMAHLTERLSGEPGRRLLTDNYKLLCSGDDYGLCLICRQADNRIGGMVVLRWSDSSPVWRLRRAGLIEIPLLLTWQIFYKPAALWSLARSLWERKPGYRAWRMAEAPGPWCFLHALVTHPSGQGNGRSLVEAALDEARRRGFKYMITSTYETIGAANHLYKSAGFAPLLTTFEKHDQVNWYGRSI
jgi:GNAT superfamily N-acetyltransferase